jgi:DNA-directed RNA polymerase specialized sigma24 family protein
MFSVLVYNLDVKELPLDEVEEESVEYAPNTGTVIYPKMSKQLEEEEFFQILEKLCPNQALRNGLAVLKLQLLDGLSFKKIAAIMGVPVGTVKPWRHRVLKHLQSKKDIFKKNGFLD